MLTSTSNVLLTGATGLIGGELLRGLIEPPVRRIWALARPHSQSAISTRLAHRLGRNGEGLEGLETCLVPVAGDVCEPHLGLGGREADLIRHEADLLIHCAATTSFMHREACRKTNVLGMERLIAFARTCVRTPLIVQVSTAANCGDTRGHCLTEQDGCRPEAPHYNEYTRTKAQAEALLRQSGLPALIVRPSIVLSAGLQEARFARTILWCLPLLNALGTAPINPASRLDVVSVQFVVESLLKLLRKPVPSYDGYHLSAGPGGAVTCAALAQFLDEYYHRPEPIRLVPPGDWPPLQAHRLARNPEARLVLARLRHYLPFFNMDTVFDNQRLLADLGPELPPNPRLFSYLGNLLEQFSFPEALRASRNP